MIESILGRVAGGIDLTMDEMAATIEAIMHGAYADEQIALLLTALRAKGESVEEIAGAASAMRKCMTQIRGNRAGLLDTCGTGGDGASTFNISTAAALVAAAAGAVVAKHGNRSITSKSGSSDVLSQLGVNVEARVPQVENCLNQLGICFCYAPLFHQSMKHVAAVRRQLGVPTIFNILGPLCNPASAPYQLIGVGRPELRPLLSAALVELGAKRAVVVHGEDGLDEVTIDGPTSVSEAAGGQVREFLWSPGDFGLSEASKDSMKVDGPQASAAKIQGILDGQLGPSRDIVVLNAAAAIWTAGLESDTQVAAQRAAHAIDTGAARSLLAQLADVSHQAV